MEGSRGCWCRNNRPQWDEGFGKLRLVCSSVAPSASGKTGGWYVRSLAFVWALFFCFKSLPAWRCCRLRQRTTCAVAAPQAPSGLRVRGGQQRHIVPPPPAQRRPPVLLPVGQRLGQRLPFALGQEQDGEHGQQCQRGVDDVMQEVAVVVSQVHDGRAQAAHATQSQDDADAAAPANTPFVTFTLFLLLKQQQLICL